VLLLNPLHVTSRSHSACALFYTPGRQAHHRSQPFSEPNHHSGTTAWHRFSRKHSALDDEAHFVISVRALAAKDAHCSIYSQSFVRNSDGQLLFPYGLSSESNDWGSVSQVSRSTSRIF
jgi:hypothetical protein